jgi:hypothetical protein
MAVPATPGVNYGDPVGAHGQNGRAGEHCHSKSEANPAHRQNSQEDGDQCGEHCCGDT